MKRWFPLFAFVSLLFIWAAGCGGDDLFQNQTIGGGDASTSDATSGGDATTGSDGSVTDGGSDGRVNDGGEDAALDSGEDADSGFDAGTDSGPPDAGPPFDVTAAAATTPTTVTVTFDAAPVQSQAETAANYGISDGTNTIAVSAASLAGNVVTLTTAPQSGVSYTVTVSGVTRAGDLRALTTNTAMFTGLQAFNVTSATSTSNTTVDVTFNATPTQVLAEDETKYTIPGLTVSAAVLNGQTVRLTTSSQSSTSYTVTVADVTRAGDGQALSIDAATFNGSPTFNVVQAQSTSTTKVDVTFDAVPDQATAEDKTNYVITPSVGPALNVTNAVRSGSIVTLTTDAQSAVAYTVTVSNVVRDSDHQALATNSAMFGGTGTFNVTAVQGLTSTTVQVTFSDDPDPTAAATAASYAITDGVNPLAVNKATVVDNVVTLTTDPQVNTTYTVTVSGVTRALDGATLLVDHGTFVGRPPFKIITSDSTGPFSAEITFGDMPNPFQANVAANYLIPGLVVTNASLGSATVTLTTGLQSGSTVYDVTIANVTRASDGEPLFTNTTSFGGTDLPLPTVTSVTVASTSPDNGTTPYNTGSTTVTIVGTDFSSVDCTTNIGVALDDTDGSATPVAVNTKATSCTVTDDNDITATFPAGIRTNGAAGWNVIVTNARGASATPSQKFVPVAGLLISQVYTGTTGSTTHEFFQLYNPTTKDIAISDFTFHIRNGGAAATVTDDIAQLSAPILGTSGSVPSHGFMLFVSSAASADGFAANADYTYTMLSGSGLVTNGGIYVSRNTSSSAKEANVIDKVGWGTQVAGGFEGTAISPSIPSGSFAQRKPGSPSGNATDSDVNSSDFLAAVTLGATVPKGSSGATEP